jgi:hypothetical protein
LVALSANIAQRPVGSKSKDYWADDKNILSIVEPEEWRDTAG